MLPSISLLLVLLLLSLMQKRHRDDKQDTKAPFEVALTEKQEDDLEQELGKQRSVVREKQDTNASRRTTLLIELGDCENRLRSQRLRKEITNLSKAYNELQNHYDTALKHRPYYLARERERKKERAKKKRYAEREREKEEEKERELRGVRVSFRRGSEFQIQGEKTTSTRDYTREREIEQREREAYRERELLREKEFVRDIERYRESERREREKETERGTKERERSI
jgi:hypothetical protein